jgi:hypothetical protein
MAFNVLSAVGIICINKFARQVHHDIKYNNWNRTISECNSSDKNIQLSGHQFLSYHNESINDPFRLILQPNSFLKKQGFENALTVVHRVAPIDACMYQQKLEKTNVLSELKVDNWGAIILLLIESGDEMHLPIIVKSFKSNKYELNDIKKDVLKFLVGHHSKISTLNSFIKMKNTFQDFDLFSGCKVVYI